jgi:hypothetical protein
MATPLGRTAELWIGETAAAWASGTAGVCNGFVSGFWWLDQLGHAASTAHGAMCRQCLVGGLWQTHVPEFSPPRRFFLILSLVPYHL